MVRVQLLAVAIFLVGFPSEAHARVVDDYGYGVRYAASIRVKQTKAVKKDSNRKPASQKKAYEYPSWLYNGPKY